MKHKTFSFLLAVLMSMVASVSSAHDFVVDGIYYKITSSATPYTASVTYRGDSYSSYSNEYTGSVTIPETVTYNGKTYSVTEIDYYAFYECSGLTSIEIPNSVTSIYNYAFYGCSGLTSVEIPNSVTSIYSYAFSGCSGLTSIVVESGNTKYDSRNGCNAIIATASNTLIAGCKNTIIPNSVTSIGSSAFRGCSSLTSVEIPNSVTSIGYEAFRGCSGLTSVVIPNSVTSIGERAFYNCSGIRRFVSLTSNVSIGSNCFYGITCSIAVPLGSENSYRGKGASSVVGGFYTGNVFYVAESENKCSVYWGSGEDINIPAEVEYNGNKYGVSSINQYAFYENKKLQSITIPSSVTSIGSGAFRGCTGLTSVTIPESVTSIDLSAFSGCSGLTSVTIPESVTSIDLSAFSGCSGLTSVFFNAKNCTKCGSSIFGAFPSTIKTLTIGNEVKTIPSFAFSDCEGLTSVAFNAINCTTCGSSNLPAFPSTIKTLTIGNEVKTIPSYAFNNCTGLLSISIGTGVRSIASGAFSKKLIKTIWLTNTPPSGYESVAGTVNYVANDQYTALSNVKVYPYLSSMFEADGVKYVPVSPSERTCDAIDCLYDGREEVNINATVSFKGVAMNVKEVGPYALYRHSAKKMEISNQGTIGDGAFQGCSGLEMCTLGDGITAIGQYAFDGCGALQGMAIPESVTSIGERAFRGCSSIVSATIGKSVKSIGSYAFSGCSSLPSIEIPKAVNSVGDYAFSGCSKLKTVAMEEEASELQLGSNGKSPLFADCPLDSVFIGRNISYATEGENGYSPFYRNTSLRSVHITNVETEVSPNEFYGCSALKNVRLGDGITAIGDWAFSGCSSIDYFLFGSSTETIGKEAFSDCTAMTHLISRAPVPPTCDDQALDDINKWNCTLEVPVGSLTAYQAAPQWKEFFFMEEGTTAVEGLPQAISQGEGGVYDLSGRKVADNSQFTIHNSQLRKGIYIVNGRRVVVK